MAYFDQAQLRKIGFKYLGKNVKVSDKASIYDPEKIEIGLVRSLNNIWRTRKHAGKIPPYSNAPQFYGNYWISWICN